VVFDNLFSYVPLVLLLAMAHAQASRPITRIETLPEPRSEASQGLLAAVAVVATVTLIWVVNVPNIKAAGHLVYAVSPSSAGIDTNLALFKQALEDGSFASQEIREQLARFTDRVVAEESVPNDIKEAFVELALEEMAKEVALSPNDARLRVQYAMTFASAGRTEDADVQFAKAIELSPKKQVLYLNRAFKLYQLGKTAEARAAFQYAYELDPSFDEVASIAAAGHLLTGDIAGGKALLMEALGTTTADNDTLFYAYHETKQWTELVAVARVRVAAQNGSAESRFRLAKALAAAGRFAEARTEVFATITAHPDARAEGEALLAQMPQAAR
jgi:tetratricopeptide (TPR) repeat protein